MRREFLICLAVVLLTAGFAAANTVWNPTEPNAIAAGYTNWNIAANWTLGVPGLGTETPPQDPKAVFNVASRPECIVDSAVACNQMAMGDGGALTGNFLRIKNGGSLSTGLAAGLWTAIGYNRQSTLTVEKGGTLTVGQNLLIGRDGSGVETAPYAPVGQYPSYLTIDGGTVVVTTTCQLGNNDAGKVEGGGIVKLNSGVLNVGGFAMQKQAVSRLDIKYGTLIINGNATANLTNWTTGASTPGNVKIVTGFGGKGTVVFDYNVRNAGKTTVTATSPMAPSPAYGSMVGEGTVALGWTNMDPNFPGDPVYVDVWFGTDPNKLSLAYTKVVTAQNTTTVNVTAPVIGTPPTTYYWQVDSYIYGSPTGTPIEGDVFKFDVTNDFPPTVVIDTPNTVTWANQPVQMNATVTDTGTSAMTYTWTSNPAGVVFSNPTGVNGDPDTTATANPATFPTTYTLTCSVKDAQSPTVVNTDARDVVVYATACTAARRTGAPGIPVTDVDGDCDTDIDDLYTLLSDWTTDYTILEPTAIP